MLMIYVAACLMALPMLDAVLEEAVRLVIAVFGIFDGGWKNILRNLKRLALAAVCFATDAGLAIAVVVLFPLTGIPGMLISLLASNLASLKIQRALNARFGTKPTTFFAPFIRS